MPAPQQAETPQEFIRREARAMGVPEALALGVAEQESSFNPMAVGKEFDLGGGRKTRAYGMFQMLPETAAQYAPPGKDPLASVQDPVENVRMGLRYLKELHAQHGGRLDDVLKAYGGVRTDTTYIPTATAKILKWQESLAKDPATQHLRPATWREQHPYVDAASRSFDPRLREGRQNLAAGVGGMLGMLRGPKTAIAGAGLASGLENSLLEETGVAPVAAAALDPWGTTPPPEAPPAPGSTPLGRTTEAAAWGAAGEGIGQGLVGLGKGIAKRFIQSDVAKGAFDYLAAQKQAAVAKLQDAVEALTEAAGWNNLGRNDATRAAQAAADAATKATELAGQQTVKGVARTGAQDIRLGRETKSALTTQARDAAARELRSARQRAAELLKRNTAQGAAGVEEATSAYTGNVPPRPSFIDAGQATIDAVEGPAREAYSALGRAVDEAAEAAEGEVDIRALKEEAARIARRELLPPETSFPRAAAAPPEPPAPSSIIDPTTGQPFVRSAPDAATAAASTADDDLMGLAGELSEEELAQLKANPAMHVIGRILRAGDTVPFRDAHLWKSQLQRAISGTYDKTQRSQAENITMKVAKELRKSLSGNPAYDAATAAYERASPAFTEHVGSTIRQVARDSPEQVVELLNPDRPSHARTLISLLTDYAARGGETGAKAGREALDQVRAAWFHKNVLEGGVEGLGERMAALRSRPEFADAVFGKEYQEVFDNLDQIVAAYNDKVVEAASLQTTAKMQGKHAVETATDTGRAEVEAARRRAEAALQGTRTAARTARDAAADEAAAKTRTVAAQGKASVAATRRSGAVDRLGERRELRGKRRELSTRRAGTGNTPGEIAEREFAESSLGGANLKRPEQAAADLMHAVLLGPKNVWGGLSLARMARGATDADILKYAIHSQDKGRVRALVAAIRAARFPGVPEAVGAPIKVLRTTQADRDAARRQRDAKEAEERRQRNTRTGSAP